VEFLLLQDIARLTLGIIFVQSSVAKWRDMASFGAILRDYGVLPRGLVGLFAWAVPIGEVITGLLLIAPIPAIAGSALGLLLLIAVTSAVLVNLRRGRTEIECGCGGATGQRLSYGLVWRNLVLVAGLILASTRFLPMKFDFVSGSTLLLATGLFVLLYFAVNQLLVNAQSFAGAGS
jgi:uncharacterized membrane protein YphA (DoxX/SURF4 family)